MEVKDILTKELVVFDLEATTKEMAIEEMAAIMDAHDILTDKASYIQAVFDRETHATTGIGNNIAIPHGKSESVKNSAIVFAKTSHLIEWESLDDEPVNMIFLLAISDADKTDGHLKILAEIATKLMDDDIVAGLKETRDEEEVIRILNEGVVEV
ncbi:PTS sugar transporter subunit IIA [Listeria grandensis]|uniref:PTS system, fructose-specific, IIA component n=2 Tax=Listeria grandensis TaxID=1494963 RepID=W7B738_9LIST|nr:PTS sugar transporter subunit IIA [Listeria grandensis]EUJ21732.1 PTS system, fructose-specific, IIA component [Listeria grandensis FSL F6-0971]MBC1474044.1 PTS sugar transporter subunit IIA [Listeria grandensis]MBC1936354.1 PTS sugar transporter subunit IIA [Listeria grandensis]MBC6316220.1 PTS sugar transporter subunit IIA [Listeria grandensis]